MTAHLPATAAFVAAKLWEEPPWVEAWPVGTSVRSAWTNNDGVIVGHDEGRRLLVKWNRWRNEPDGFECFHSSPQGLIREVQS